MNVERLKAYQARLIIFPRRTGQYKKGDSSKEEVGTVNEGNISRKIHSVIPVVNEAQEAAIGEIKISDMGEGESAAYRKLRDAWSVA